MTSEEFNTQAFQTLIENFKTKMIAPCRYIIDTPFGELQILFDPTPKIKVYSIFMKFLDLENFDHKTFKEWFEVECHSLIMDTVGGEIFDDEI